MRLKLGNPNRPTPPSLRVASTSPFTLPPRSLSAIGSVTPQKTPWDPLRRGTLALPHGQDFNVKGLNTIYIVSIDRCLQRHREQKPAAPFHGHHIPNSMHPNRVDNRAYVFNLKKEVAIVCSNRRCGYQDCAEASHLASHGNFRINSLDSFSMPSRHIAYV